MSILNYTDHRDLYNEPLSSKSNLEGNMITVVKNSLSRKGFQTFNL